MSEPKRTILDPRMHAIHVSRGILLDFINGVYPNGLDREIIYRAMLESDDRMDQSTVDRDLAYLEGRGLIDKSRDPHHAKRDRFIVHYTLTAKGEHFVQLGKPWDRLEKDF